MNKKIFLVFGMFFLFLILALTFSSAQDVCCEKTKDGAWCQNDDVSNCASGYAKTPTSCDQTSYCKTGTCIDQSEGRCISNTPQNLCEEQGGFWDQRDLEEIPSCQIGCCFLENGDTSPVTQTRCSALSGELGIDVKEFRSDITDQFECLASATSPEEGACVLDNGIQRECKRTTRQECNSLESSSISTEFSEDYLCSAQFLETVCGPSQDTTCLEDKVYFLDSCGNIANLYDSSKYGDPLYWNKIIPPEEAECSTSIDRNGNVVNSASCGNCALSAGSFCEVYERGVNAKPNMGDYVCSDLSCKDGNFADIFKEENGRYPIHGESWCITSNYELTNYDEVNQFSPGEESYTLKCYNGEITAESASTGEWRQKICREYVDPDTGKHFAAPIQNDWMDCLEQMTQGDCEDIETRDCVWMEGHSIYRDEDNKPLALDKDDDPVEATCVPRYSPSFDFWKEDSKATEICSVASYSCVVTFELGSMTNAREFGSWSPKTKASACTNNCYCLEGYESWMDTKDKHQRDYLFDSYEEWVNSIGLVCSSLGDCGLEVNYVGEEGYHTDDDILDSNYFRNRKKFDEWVKKQ